MNGRVEVWEESGRFIGVEEIVVVSMNGEDCVWMLGGVLERFDEVLIISILLLKKFVVV